MLDGLKLSNPIKSTDGASVGSEIGIVRPAHIDYSQYSSIIRDDLEDEACFDEKINMIDVGSLNRSFNKLPMSQRGEVSPTISRGKDENSDELTVASFRKVEGTSGMIKKFNKHVD